MRLIDPKLDAYAESMTTSETEALHKLNRETHLKFISPQMLSGPIQGRFLSMVSKMIRPKQVLEVGTYTGYSAICLAEGLAEGGKVHTIDLNPELESQIRKGFAESGMEDKIEFHLGDGRDIIPQLPGPFDLIFIDADKPGYAEYYDFVFDQWAPGGFMLADNVLWSGKVVDPSADGDTDTEALRAFSKKVAEDERVEQVLLPLRDGLLLVRKHEEA